MRNRTRRSFIKSLFFVLPKAIVSSTGILLFNVSRAKATGLPILNEKSINAKLMGYYHDANKVDKVQYPSKDKEYSPQTCENCVYLISRGIRPGNVSGEWGKCTVFRNSLVNVDGWCKKWHLVEE